MMIMFISGLISAIMFFSCLGCSFYIGYKLGSKKKVVAKEVVDEKEQLELKRREQGFKNIMDYDYAKATERRVIEWQI